MYKSLPIWASAKTRVIGLERATYWNGGLPSGLLSGGPKPTNHSGSCQFPLSSTMRSAMLYRAYSLKNTSSVLREKRPTIAGGYLGDCRKLSGKRLFLRILEISSRLLSATQQLPPKCSGTRPSKLQPYTFVTPSSEWSKL